MGHLDAESVIGCPRCEEEDLEGLVCDAWKCTEQDLQVGSRYASWLRFVAAVIVTESKLIGVPDCLVPEVGREAIVHDQEVEGQGRQNRSYYEELEDFLLVRIRLLNLFIIEVCPHNLREFIFKLIAASSIITQDAILVS